MATETKRAAEIRLRLEAVNGFKIKSKEVRTVREPLTPAQLATIASEMAAAALQANAYEEEKKLMTKQLKDKKDEQDAIVTALAQTYEKGYEDNEADVFVVADFHEKVRRIFSIKTGLQVAQEPLQDQDFQEEMKLKPKAETPAQDGPKAPEKGEARMVDENEVVIMQNPERIALGFERDSAEGGTTTEDGSHIEDADYEVVDADAKDAAPEVIELITQIHTIEKKKGIVFINTAENLVLFTDNQSDIDKAQANIDLNAAGRKKGKSFYVVVTYIKSESRNHQLKSIAEREVQQTGEDATDIGIGATSDFEIKDGDDPDGLDAPAAPDPEITDPDEEEQY